MANKCWTKPAVYIHNDVDKELRNELKDIVKRHDGKIVGKFIVNKPETILASLIISLKINHWCRYYYYESFIGINACCPNLVKRYIPS